MSTYEDKSQEKVVKSRHLMQSKVITPRRLDAFPIWPLDLQGETMIQYMYVMLKNTKMYGIAYIEIIVTGSMFCLKSKVACLEAVREALSNTYFFPFKLLIGV